MFAEDDLADSNPYVLAQPERAIGGGRAVSQVSGVKVFWRRQLGKVEKFFRWINQTAYLVSVPFLMVLLLGIMVRSHPMANLARSSWSRSTSRGWSPEFSTWPSSRSATGST